MLVDGLLFTRFTAPRRRADAERDVRKLCHIYAYIALRRCRCWFTLLLMMLTVCLIFAAATPADAATAFQDILSVIDV